MHSIPSCAPYGWRWADIIKSYSFVLGRRGWSFPPRSHALRGNTRRDALRPLRCNNKPRRRASHTCIPTLCVGTRIGLQIVYYGTM